MHHFPVDQYQATWREVTSSAAPPIPIPSLKAWVPAACGVDAGTLVLAEMGPTGEGSGSNEWDLQGPFPTWRRGSLLATMVKPQRHAGLIRCTLVTSLPSSLSCGETEARRD